MPQFIDQLTVPVRAVVRERRPLKQEEAEDKGLPWPPPEDPAPLAYYEVTEIVVLEGRVREPGDDFAEVETKKLAEVCRMLGLTAKDLMPNLDFTDMDADDIERAVQAAGSVTLPTIRVALQTADPEKSANAQDILTRLANERLAASIAEWDGDEPITPENCARLPRIARQAVAAKVAELRAGEVVGG